LSRSAKDIVTNEVKLGLGAQNTNIRRNTVLHRFDKLGIGRKKIRNGTTPNQKHMGEKWSAKLPAHLKPEMKTGHKQKQKKKLQPEQKKEHPENQNPRCKERMSKV